MNSVTVNTDELLAIVKDNRDKHRKVFEAAHKGFRKQLEKQLSRRLKKARRGARVELFIRLDEPVNHTKDYDRVIKMLSMNVGDTVEIEEDDFAMYAMDDFPWKDAFLSNSKIYAGKLSKRVYG